MDLLQTDFYKFRMMEIGYPLREEVFVFTLRKGGPHYIPFDLGDFVRKALPSEGSFYEGLRYLSTQGLSLSKASVEALRSPVHVTAVPAGSWVPNRAPVFTVRGPQAIVSWLEANLIGPLAFRIQAATLIQKGEYERLQTVPSALERSALEEVFALIHPGEDMFPIKVAPLTFAQYNRQRAEGLLQVVDASRVMESGLRAAPSWMAHMLAAQAVQSAGFRTTSAVMSAKSLNMTPVGTTGHEHTIRLGSDYDAFAAAVDRTTGPTTMLLDTFSTQGSGIPAAMEILKRRPNRGLSTRLDSEATMEEDFRFLVDVIRQEGIPNPPKISLGGGFNLEKTRMFEDLAQDLDWPKDMLNYQYGQYLNDNPWGLPTRGEVGAVYKLAETDGTARMKFSDRPEKSSLPGRTLSVWCKDTQRVMVVQESEGMTQTTPLPYTEEPVVLSDLTQQMLRNLEAKHKP